MTVISKKLYIDGQVQGVYYHEWGQAEARKLGISGWIKDTDNGQVEAIITGKEELVDHFIADCHEGPLAAQVENVEVEDIQTKTFEDFSIIEPA